MPKKNIVIAGGGFAGCEALRVLGKRSRVWSGEYRITLIDEKRNAEFLPMLPDILSGRISERALQRDLGNLCGRWGAEFLNARMESFDLDERTVNLAGGDTVKYDKLIIATGAEVNFFGNELLRKNCRKLYSCEDATELKDALLTSMERNGSLKVLIVGGGYTGVEIASNISLLARKEDVPAEITLLEASEDILGMTPGWVRRLAREELDRSGVAIKCGDALEDYDGTTARLASGEGMKEVICVWSAGVKVSSALGALNGDGPGGRIKVSRRLVPQKNSGGDLWLCGDPAAFFTDNKPLRMAVMFSMGQGKIAACNLLRSLTGKKEKSYKARDLGFLVPFATGTAYGPVLGSKVRGRTGYLLHYAMCLYRSCFSNKIAILKWWLSGHK